MGRADPWKLATARRLRQDATEGELLLWRELRRWPKAHWRRQWPLAGSIVDFYAHPAKLAVELDGGQHFDSDAARKDEERDTALAMLGVRVVRFDNATLFTKTNDVLQEIWRIWTERSARG